MSCLTGKQHLPQYSSDKGIGRPAGLLQAGKLQRELTQTASALLNLHLLLPLMQRNTLFLLLTSRKFKQSMAKTMSAIFKTESCLAQKF